MDLGPARRVGRDFFARPTLEVAADLVGCELRHRTAQGLESVELVEVEAYLGEGEDPASHAHRGRTPRNRNMFETPGRLYVYLSYGLHHCLNVVCESRGRAGAVLLRAARPIEGLERMASRRGRSGHELTNGPGKLAQALGADLEWDGRDLVRGSLGLWSPPQRPSVRRSGRIGISSAQGRRYRFFRADSPWVSRAKPSL